MIEKIELVLLLVILVPLDAIYRNVTHIGRAVRNLPNILDSKIKDSQLRLYRQVEALAVLNASIRAAVPLPSLRGWAASPDFLLELARIVLARSPSTIVECICGSSTVVAARACQLLGSSHVYSLEHESRFANETSGRLEDAELQQWQR